MEDNAPKPTVSLFTVTECPPWYLTSDYKDVFSCKTSKGLFEAVAKLMVCNQIILSEQAKRYSPKNIYKTIKDMVINQSDKLPHKPSSSLLLALMDLMEMEGEKRLCVYAKCRQGRSQRRAAGIR